MESKYVEQTLHECAKNDNYRRPVVLLMQGFPVNKVDKRERTALIVALDTVVNG